MKIASRARGLFVASVVWVGACGPGAPPPEAEVVVVDSVPRPLEEHTAEFEQRVYEVTDGVHVAVGFGLANSILVEGDDCAFVVDVHVCLL